MKNKTSVLMASVVLMALCILVASVGAQDKKPAGVMSLKLEGAKLAPVSFSHPTHVDKAKIDCAVCHHKDKDPKQPAGCASCHDVKQAKDKTPLAKDAFHKQCRTCHKEKAAQEAKAPTKCNECHKK